MLILAADTSGKSGSVALVRFHGGWDAPFLADSARSGRSETVDVVSLEGGTFSAQLVPQVSALLAKHNLSKSDIGAFAIASGPGSFTGLRVGLAAIKALAEALRKPIAAVSLLEAVARGAASEGRVMAALDAGRGELYVGNYEIAQGKARFFDHWLVTFAELVDVACGHRILTPDIRLADQLQAANLSVMVVPQPRADSIARLGFEKIQSGETVSPEALDATYIRPSDAEIKLTHPLR